MLSCLSFIMIVTGCSKAKLSDTNNFIATCPVGGQPQLFRCDANGECLQMTRSGKGYNTFPFVSLKRNAVYFTSNRDKNAEIYSFPILPPYNNPLRITNNSVNDTCPSVSMDGQYLTYVSESDGNRDVYAYDTDTQKLIQVTRTPENETYPSFSKDGSYIVFTRLIQKKLRIVMVEIMQNVVKKEHIIPLPRGAYFHPYLFDNARKVLFTRFWKETGFRAFWADVYKGTLHEFPLPKSEFISCSLDYNTGYLIVTLREGGNRTTFKRYHLDETTGEISEETTFLPPKSIIPWIRIRGCDFAVWVR